MKGTEFKVGGMRVGGNAVEAVCCISKVSHFIWEPGCSSSVECRIGAAAD